MTPMPTGKLRWARVSGTSEVKLGAKDGAYVPVVLVGFWVNAPGTTSPKELLITDGDDNVLQDDQGNNLGFVIDGLEAGSGNMFQPFPPGFVLDKCGAKLDDAVGSPVVLVAYFEHGSPRA